MRNDGLPRKKDMFTFEICFQDENHGVNLVGQNLEAELFRQHQHPIMHLGYLDNMSRMVTVDDNGYINIWHYDP